MFYHFSNGKWYTFRVVFRSNDPEDTELYVDYCRRLISEDGELEIAKKEIKEQIEAGGHYKLVKDVTYAEGTF